MTFDEVVAYYGSAYKISRDGGFSKGSPYNWKKKGYIPIETQRIIQIKTRGKLRASLDDLGTTHVNEE